MVTLQVQSTIFKTLTRDHAGINAPLNMLTTLHMHAPTVSTLKGSECQLSSKKASKKCLTLCHHLGNRDGTASAPETKMMISPHSQIFSSALSLLRHRDPSAPRVTTHGRRNRTCTELRQDEASQTLCLQY